MTSKIKDKKLSDIVNKLLGNIYAINDISLYHGKAGIIIFLLKYTKYKREYIYNEIAYELLDDLCDSIPFSCDIDMEHGLCGLGWSIEYLLAENFIEGNSNEILENIDNKISTINYESLTDISVENGLQGIYNYVYARINSNFNLTGKSIFDKKHLNRLEFLLKTPSILSYQAFLNHITETNPMMINNLDLNLGLRNGLAGYGLRLLGCY